MLRRPLRLNSVTAMDQIRGLHGPLFCVRRPCEGSDRIFRLTWEIRALARNGLPGLIFRLRVQVVHCVGVEKNTFIVYIFSDTCVVHAREAVISTESRTCDFSFDFYIKT